MWGKKVRNGGASIVVLMGKEFVSYARLGGKTVGMLGRGGEICG